MPRALARSCTLAALLCALAPAARANIATGAVAPNFTKNELAGGPGSWSKGGPISLSDYSGKVVVLFLLGYD